MPNTRELSQLASLININDETKSIRVLVDQPDAKIGVGTENPIAKVDISGDVNVSGVVTATSFSGDGSNLSNIISGVGIQSAGVTIGTGVTTLNFIGAGNTFAINGNVVDISIAGGGGGGETDSTPGKTSGTFFATEEQTVFNYTYKPGFIDVFLNGIRLNSTEFIAGNGTTIELISPASANDVLDIVEYTMGIGAPGDPGNPGAGGPIDNITQTTTDGTFYPVITTGIGTTLPFITTTNNYFEFNPSSGTLTANQLNIVGVVTASAFFGDGSGLSGVSAGSTVADDTSTDETFFPVFTQQTSGTITASKVSTTKLTFNPSTGTLTATDINSTSDINLKENIRPIENPLDKVLQINGVEFDWKDNQQSSMGVIAQEVEKVFPSLVRTAENKSVNYNGLIGVLIEAVKEQQKQINILKKRIGELEG